MWGDPHITTLDGKEYTFNGVGEYTLLHIEDSLFRLQGRTVRAANRTARATVFSAFAATEKGSDVIQTNLNESGKEVGERFASIIP